MEELHKAQAKGDDRIQDTRTESDQTIGLLKSKLSELEKTESRNRIDLLQTKVSRMETYFEQPTWKRVEEEEKGT